MFQNWKFDFETHALKQIIRRFSEKYMPFIVKYFTIFYNKKYNPILTYVSHHLYCICAVFV